MEQLAPARDLHCTSTPRRRYRHPAAVTSAPSFRLDDEQFTASDVQALRTTSRMVLLLLLLRTCMIEHKFGTLPLDPAVQRRPLPHSPSAPKRPAVPVTRCPAGLAAAASLLSALLEATALVACRQPALYTRHRRWIMTLILAHLSLTIHLLSE